MKTSTELHIAFTVMEITRGIHQITKRFHFKITSGI